MPVWQIALLIWCGGSALTMWGLCRFFQFIRDDDKIPLFILSMQARMEQLAAEMHDPDTEQERVDEIKAELRDMYHQLVTLARQNG